MYVCVYVSSETRKSGRTRRVYYSILRRKRVFVVTTIGSHTSRTSAKLDASTVTSYSLSRYLFYKHLTDEMLENINFMDKA